MDYKAYYRGAGILRLGETNIEFLPKKERGEYVSIPYSNIRKGKKINPIAMILSIILIVPMLILLMASVNSPTIGGSSASTVKIYTNDGQKYVFHNVQRRREVLRIIKNKTN